MDKCILCGIPLQPNDFLIKCINAPMGAQNLPGKDELLHDHGVDLDVYQCSGCGLVQLNIDPVDYYKDVIRSGGYSTTMAELRRKQYTDFINVCNLTGKRLVEIGCGQGEFLQTLKEFPVQSCGIEHNAELVEKALSKGLNVKKAFADTPQTKIEGAPFDAFISFNFIEHQPRPNDMLRCIYNNLTDDGYGLITVPCFEYVLSNSAFYEFIRDHIACYTMDTMRFLVEKNGFTVIKSKLERDIMTFIVKKRRKTDISCLIKNRDTLTKQMRTLISDMNINGKKIAVWGASHQSFTAISCTGVEKSIRYIIDSAPFKQGKYAPASHVPIVSPEHFFEEPVDCIIIIAPGYTQEIAKIIYEKYSIYNCKVKVLRTEKIEDIYFGDCHND